MTTPETQPRKANEATEAAVRGGDEEAFAEMTRRYRRELHVHCYRMLASFEEAEDLVQETFLRAWQKRNTFEGRASFRAWLYQIATNACLDFLAKHDRRVVEIAARGDTSGSVVVPHVAWLQPYPDRLLAQAAHDGSGPEAAVLRKETIELAFVVAMQYLPAKQRAVLVLRDILEWSASETAALLESSVPVVNSALQRARATLKRHQPTRHDAAAHRTSAEEEQDLIKRYVDATERCDADALVMLLSADARFSMPPAPTAFIGNAAIVRSWVEGGFGAPPFDDFKCIVTAANGMPAVANYVRRPDANHHEAFAVDVLRMVDGRIAEVTAFEIADLLDAFALPRTIS